MSQVVMFVFMRLMRVMTMKVGGGVICVIFRCELSKYVVGVGR